ncbi:MAG: PEP-CTERM sorting domain-containing protein [Rhodocyclaceae bacterium]|nr:PEP-CTERM sorting domain-containing protein [Rhodocyclaceae bacterium]
MLLQSMMKSLRLPAVLLGLAISPLSQAVEFTGSQTAAGTWTYNLTYNPLDNYSVFPVDTQPSNLTTITLTGLFGVTGATGPSSSTFVDPWLNGINLAWSAEVLNGGTTVRWTHVGPGTGNFGVDMHVYGFQVFATGAVDGWASVATNGFSTDTTNGGLDRDITGRVLGPVAAVPEPETWALLMAGLGLMGGIARRRRAQG